MKTLSEIYAHLDVKVFLVGHLDPLTLTSHFSNKIDLDDGGPDYSYPLLYTCIEQEIECFENGGEEIDEHFFNMVTLDGRYELVTLKLLDVATMVCCHDGVYREFPSLIMTVRSVANGNNGRPQ